MNHSVKRRRQALHQTHDHYYLNTSVEAANLSDRRIESNRNFFAPNWNALVSTATPIEHRIGGTDATLVDSRLLLLLLLLVTKAVFCGA